MKKLIFLILGGVIVVGLVYVNQHFRGAPQKLTWTVVPPAPTPVEARKPQRRGISHLVTAPGTIQPIFESQIGSQVVGRIVDIPVQEGDMVKKDEVLARLDDADYKARVRSAEARVERAKASIRQMEAELAKAERDDRRSQDLASSGAASKNEQADTQTAVARAVAARDMAKQESVEAQGALEAAETDLARTVIRSPIDGLVAQILLEKGEMLIPGTMNLPGAVFMVISDMTRIEVKAQIDESDVALVKPGQRAWIYLTTDDRGAIPGVVKRVTPKGVRTGEVTTFEARILLEAADARLRSGLTASAEIEVRKHEDALAVPIQAVRHRKRKDLPADVLANAPSETVATAPASASSPATAPADRLRRGRDPDAEYLKVVFVIHEGKAQARLVRTDISDENYVELAGGVGPEDQVVTGPYRVLDVLQHGQTVEPAAPPTTQPAT